MITQLEPYPADEFIFAYLLLLQAIGTYMSRGILNIVAVKVFGLNVTKINVSPLNAWFAFKPSCAESTPIINTVNGSVKLFSFEALNISLSWFSMLSEYS